MQELFDEAGITWWMDYGMLLGAVRNPLLGIPPGMIPHDKDGDVGVLATHVDQVHALRLVFQERGFGWVWRGPSGDASKVGYGGGNRWKIRTSEINHTNIDVFPWYERDDGLMYRIRYIGVDRYKGREFPKARLLPLVEMEWEGLLLPAPADPEWFVEHRYGPNWRTPIGKHEGDGKKR
jgi:phosphorylcholine metabolism protein LicD